MVYPVRKLVRNGNVVRFSKSSITPEPEDLLRREFIKFTNTLRCPICDAGLDGSISEEANLFCRANPYEYHCQYMTGNHFLIRDRIQIKIDDYLYEITHSLDENTKQYFNQVWQKEINESDLYSFKFQPLLLIETEGEQIFPATCFNKQDFIKKVEVYCVFT